MALWLRLGHKYLIPSSATDLLCGFQQDNFSVLPVLPVPDLYFNYSALMLVL